jgi:hypothetical protein
MSGISINGSDNLNLNSHSIVSVNDLACTTINGGSPGVSYPLLASDGSQPAPSYSFASQTNTGLWVTAGPFLNICVAGTVILQLKNNIIIGQGYNFNMNTGSFISVFAMSSSPGNNLNITNFNGNSLITVGSGSNVTLSFYNQTPTTQPTATGATGFTANASANSSFAESTYTGSVGATAYTVGDIVASLKNLGLIAS